MKSLARIMISLSPSINTMSMGFDVQDMVLDLSPLIIMESHLGIDSNTTDRESLEISDFSLGTMAFKPEELTPSPLTSFGGHLLDEHGRETDQVCGCSVTAEEKNKPLKDGTTKTYHYYRCSRNKSDGRCSQRDTKYMQEVGRTVSYAESEIEMLFEAVFRPFSWTPELVKRMQEILRAEHSQKSGDHKVHVASLRRRYEMLQTYMDKAYDDKLAGDLAPDQWREKNERWKREREEVKAKIDTLDEAKDEYIENGVLLIELAQHTEKFYKLATPEQKRQLVEIISSNRVLKDGSIEIDYRKPFDLLAVSGSEEKWWRRGELNPRPQVIRDKALHT